MTKEELKQLKKETEDFANKIKELSLEELEIVSGGNVDFWEIIKKIGEDLENKTKPVTPVPTPPTVKQ